jgi:hypothetical protein
MVYEYLDKYSNFLDVMRRGVFYKIASGIRNLSATYVGTDICKSLVELAEKMEKRLYFVT